MIPPGAISPATTHIMLALETEYAQEGRATVRRVALRAGRNVSSVHQHLEVLKAHGLVTWQPGTQGTLRPTTRTLNPTSSP